MKDKNNCSEKSKIIFERCTPVISYLLLSFLLDISGYIDSFEYRRIYLIAMTVITAAGMVAVFIYCIRLARKTDEWFYIFETVIFTLIFIADVILAYRSYDNDLWLSDYFANKTPQ